MSARAAVAKTYKLYLGGAFVRSESGRTDPLERRERAARLAQGHARRGQGRTRRRSAGGRRRRPTTAGRCCTGSRRRSSRARTARDEYGEAIDLLVHYAGWTDKLAAVMGGVNPVAAPFL